MPDPSEPHVPSEPDRPAMSRREAMGTGLAAAAGACSALGGTQGAADGLPLVDYHVHLDNFGLEKALEVSRKKGVNFGIVEHAGTKENKYPVVLSNDAELARYIAMLDGKPVFKGVQTEWVDWLSCFSKDVVARLDYVLTDAMTFPGRDGQRVKLWQRDAPQRVDMDDREAFMDRYVDWYVAIMAKQPIDILANASWLPAPLARDWDAFWTPARVRRVVEAARRYGVAIEISSSLKLPKLSFLEQVKDAGVKFSFGSNIRGERMGTLDYCLAMARELGLRREDLFVPAPPGRKPVQVRKL
jgi:histidinol phosphatase-like PHP family hydrolase